MAGDHIIVRLEDVSHAYSNTPVLQNIELCVKSREFLTLLGPSGCGKTTILRIIAGFETPTRGRVFIDGRDQTLLPPNQRRINTVFQSYALFPHMTVFDNVAFGLKMDRLPKGQIRNRVDAILRMVKLDMVADRKPHQLSGGQQQRVAIARAAVKNPLVLLLDEPLNALDARLRREMQRELKHLQRKLGITFIFVTHDQQEALSMSDRIVVMDQGRIEQTGSPIEIYEEPVNLKVATFVGEANLLAAHILPPEPGWPEGTVGAEVDGENRVFLFETRRSFQPGLPIQVVLRPEDLVVQREPPDDISDQWLEGVVEETIYKGTTYDIVITLRSGRQLLVTEFFDEDAEEMIVSSGERVYVTWIKGWEVVLPDDAQGTI